MARARRPAAVGRARAAGTRTSDGAGAGARPDPRGARSRHGRREPPRSRQRTRVRWRPPPEQRQRVDVPPAARPARRAPRCRCGTRRRGLPLLPTSPKRSPAPTIATRAHRDRPQVQVGGHQRPAAHAHRAPGACPPCPRTPPVQRTPPARSCRPGAAMSTPRCWPPRERLRRAVVERADHAGPRSGQRHCSAAPAGGAARQEAASRARATARTAHRTATFAWSAGARVFSPTLRGRCGDRALARASARRRTWALSASYLTGQRAHRCRSGGLGQTHGRRLSSPRSAPRTAVGRHPGQLGHHLGRRARACAGLDQPRHRVHRGPISPAAAAAGPTTSTTSPRGGASA